MDKKIKELLDRYPTVEDSKEKSKIRKQLRKLGYYLSQEKKESAAPAAKTAPAAAKPDPAPAADTDSGNFIFLEFQVNGETVSGRTVDISTGKIIIDITPAN